PLHDALPLLSPRLDRSAREAPGRVAGLPRTCLGGRTRRRAAPPLAHAAPRRPAPGGRTGAAVAAGPGVSSLAGGRRRRVDRDLHAAPGRAVGSRGPG